MKITGEITVAAPRERVFEALRDARLFASCVEGVRDLVAIDDRHYSAVLDAKVAYMTFSFSVTVELTRAEPPEVIEARIEGAPRGVVGRLTAVSRTTLTESEDGTTIAYEIDAALAGKLGSLGQPVLRAKAKDMERAFAVRLAAAFPQPAEAAS